MAAELITYNNGQDVVIYQSQDGTLQLNVQIAQDTVWLTQQQIAELFDVKQPAISKHISNIYNTGELDKDSTYSILEYMGNDGKQRYQTKYYNLDMILAVGYRVNSRHATFFRRWATGVLKDYLLRGAAINQRLLHIEERIDNRLMAHEQQINALNEKVEFFVRTALPPAEKVFFGGEFFDARVALENIIRTAKQRVVIIDAYVDATTFEMLDVRDNGVKASIYSGKDLTNLRDMHNAQPAVEPIDTFVWTTPSHDRWLIVDDTVFHCGHSLKDMGRKMSAISQMGISAEKILNEVR